MHRAALLGPTVLLGLTVLLAGCAQRAPVASTSGARVYSFDLIGGAKQCNAPKPRLAEAKTTDVALKLANDGGWCAITVARAFGTADQQPYAAGLLRSGPAHGTVYIHTVGDVTRIDYTPRPGFVGTDRFTVSLLPGQPVIVATVTVTR
jgi:hypothetical protein